MIAALGETATDVLVIGAGPAGLTLANVLVRGGASVRVVDRKDAPTDQTRALIVHAKTLELLDRLDLAERAVAEGARIGAMELLAEGTPAGKVSFFEDGTNDRTPYPYALSYAQSQTERLLLRSLEEHGGGVEWQTELVALTQTPEGVRAAVRRADGTEETVAARWAVGADGAHSPVRHALGLTLEGETYEQSLFLADVDVRWNLGSQQVYFDLTRLGFNGFFSMPGGDDRYRLLGSLPPELAARDVLTLDEVRQLLREQSSLDVEITEARWISVYRIHHRMAKQFRVGRVFLAGDAAHIHSPAGGQGMNTGIGDAYNLGWKLALVATGQARESLLDSYEAERIPFARAILGGSDRGFIAAVTTNPVGQRAKLVAVPAAFRVLSRVPALRRRVFWLLSQLWTAYRNSPAIAPSGTAERGPHAGDRAPYAPFEDGPHAGSGIFALLRGTGHHLLLFEGRKPEAAILDAAHEEIAGLLARYALPVALHRVAAGNRKLHDRYGADVASVYLVRPDGHVAYRGKAGDLIGLKLYLDRLFVRRGEGERVAPATRRELAAR